MRIQNHGVHYQDVALGVHEGDLVNFDIQKISLGLFFLKNYT